MEEAAWIVREKTCPRCGGVLETIETSEELWVLNGKEMQITTFSLRCLQCLQKYTIRKTKENNNTADFKNWEV